MITETRKILVVDADVIMRDLLGYLLSKKNYRVSTAPNEAAVLARIKTETPDLIILGYRVFQADGLKILKKIRQYYEEISIIILTNFVTRKLKKNACSLGLVGFLRKRISVDLFIKLIQGALKRKGLRNKIKT